MSTLHTKGTPTRELESKGVKAMLDEGNTVLVDVREPDEHRHERIPGAVSIPLSKFSPDELRQFSGKRVVLHCKSGKRSADALRLASGLSAQGFDLATLKSGIEAWKAAGLSTLSGGGHGISVMRQTQMVIGAGVLAGTAGGFFLTPWLFIIPTIFGTGLIVAGATGTCGLAVMLGAMPWNRSNPGCGNGGSCST